MSIAFLAIVIILYLITNKMPLYCLLFAYTAFLTGKHNTYKLYLHA